MTSHDHNFKNVFLDFPKEALEWILPDVPKELGQIQRISFVREEPGKRRLSDAHLSLDMPILYTFEKKQALLWIVEFQEEKGRFSIYKMLRYVTDLMEQYPDALMIPTVLFTKREKWRKDVKRELNSRWGSRQFLHFEYVPVKLFDCKARDYYDHRNPVVKILLPKMDYDPAERTEVIRQAYRGLFELAAPMLFDKYVDFIDVYAGVRANEREAILCEMTEQEDTAMLAQYIRDKGFQEGRQEGRQEGELKGRLDGERIFLERLLIRRFGSLPDWGRDQLAGATLEQLDRWAERVLEADSIQAVLAE
jgi:predicted transposase YdaD